MSRHTLILVIVVLSLLAGASGFASAKQVEALAKRAGEEAPKAIGHVIIGVLILIAAVIALFTP